MSRFRIEHTVDPQVYAQGQNVNFEDRRHDIDRRIGVCKLAAELHARELVSAIASGEEVDPGAIWDACVRKAVTMTEPEPA